jgi:four helix bundle protein
MADRKCVQSFRDLLVWQKGIELAEAVYALTRPFPAEEKFGLVSQLRRAAVSVPSNIAEGQVRRSAVEFAHFLSISLGSLAELETQLMIASKLGLVTGPSAQSLLTRIHELQKMLHSLRSRLGLPR